MKRFIITNLLAILSLPILACWGGWTTNYYLFSAYERTDFSDRMDEITLKNWKAYLGLADDQSFWFNADDIIKAAQEKNDQLMVSYVENLQKYLDCGRIDIGTDSIPFCASASRARTRSSMRFRCGITRWAAA